MRDDEVREAPSSVVWAVAAGTAPLPFLGVYAFVFIIHGSVRPVAPPDITDTTGGELVAGLIALALLIVAVVTLMWMLNGSRRWPFVLVQLGMLATAIDFFLDVSKGGRTVSFVVALAALAALACSAAPQTWEYFGQQLPGPLRGPKAPEDARFAEHREFTRDPQSG